MRSPSSTCAPLMPQVSFGKQRSSRLFRFYLSSPATPFLSLPPLARLSSPCRIEWPALPSSPYGDPNIKLLPFVCTDNRDERERRGRELAIPSLFPATIKFYNRRTGIFIDVAARRRFLPSFSTGERKLSRKGRDRYRPRKLNGRREGDRYAIFRPNWKEGGEGISRRWTLSWSLRPLARVPAKIIRDTGTIGERAANKLAVA